ncbi:aminodeoxychorismate/anthranilate synthase component II [bacterium]|nr:aminodeoxychorismate/anthranilate synthase component II [bacterium]MBT7087566.1 aminodeoxychorismate/anthranilate synthase component II [bacterium]
MKILIIDNYDSFTFNLYQYLGEILMKKSKNFKLIVKRNDEITIPEIEKQKFDRIIISPGPGNPSDPRYFGICKDVLLKVGKKTPVLGICLGMQGLAHYYGGKIAPAKTPMHGKTSLITHDSQGVFKNLPQNLEVMRYHSLIVKKENLPSCLKITATAGTDIMGLRHTRYPIEGVQFHPESFATEAGSQMLRNFLERA